MTETNTTTPNTPGEDTPKKPSGGFMKKTGKILLKTLKIIFSILTFCLGILFFCIKILFKFLNWFIKKAPSGEAAKKWASGDY